MRTSLTIALVLSAAITSPCFARTEHQDQSQLKARLIVFAEGSPIQGLKWSDKRLPLVGEEKGGKLQLFAVLQGSYDRKGWVLVSEEAPVVSLENHLFQLKVPVSKQTTVVKLLAIGPHGEMETAHLDVFCELETLRIAYEVKEPVESRRLFFTPYLGFAFMSHEQPNLAYFSEWALTVRALGLYVLIPDTLDFVGSVNFTALPLATNTPGIDARELKFDVHAGYRLPVLGSPWLLTIRAGIAFRNLYVTNDLFGYRNEVEFEVFPVLQRIFDKDNRGLFYFKFSPVLDASGVGFLSDREFSTGLGWFHRVSGEHELSVFLDFASFHLENVQGAQDLLFTQTSAVLSVGYSF